MPRYTPRTACIHSSATRQGVARAGRLRSTQCWVRRAPYACVSWMRVSLSSLHLLSNKQTRNIKGFGQGGAQHRQRWLWPCLLHAAASSFDLTLAEAARWGGAGRAGLRPEQQKSKAAALAEPSTTAEAPRSASIHRRAQPLPQQTHYMLYRPGTMAAVPTADMASGMILEVSRSPSAWRESGSKVDEGAVLPQLCTALERPTQTLPPGSSPGCLLPAAHPCDG